MLAPAANPKGLDLGRRFVVFADVADEIQDADLLAWRRLDWSLDTLFIVVASRGEHYHVGMAAWWDKDLMTIDACYAGVIPTLLSEQVRLYPGVIDVFEADAERLAPDFRPDLAVQRMKSKIGRRYGFASLIRSALTRLAILRFGFRPKSKDAGDDVGLEFCSQAVSNAIRVGGGVDPTYGAADCFTDPSDIVHSPFYWPGYRFTLCQTQLQVDEFTKREAEL